ncbi:MAG: hypothetical protein IVW57_06925 [Ktedonobacterales bacterium]|nr:hypothetical protein [Ktedonobacterales bacterium]
MPLLLAALLGLAALCFVIYPLLGVERPRAAGTPVTPATELADREQSAKAALREVEFDYSLGNLEATDYQTLRERYERRALAALKLRYQREQELDAQIERELAELRARGEPDAAASPSTAARPTPAHPRGPRTRRRGKGV